MKSGCSSSRARWPRSGSPSPSTFSRALDGGDQLPLSPCSTLSDDLRRDRLMPELLRTPFGLLLVQAIVIIGAARFLGLVARKVGQPLVVAEVVAGILLGPSLLGWLSP